MASQHLGSRIFLPLPQATALTTGHDLGCESLHGHGSIHLINIAMLHAEPVRDDGPQENGLQLKRTKKRSGRRERERQARRAHAAHQEQEADRPAPAAAAFGDGFKVQDSKQAWAEGALAAPTASQ